MINAPGCCHVRSYEYVNLWKWFGPLKKHDPSLSLHVLAPIDNILRSAWFDIFAGEVKPCCRRESSNSQAFSWLQEGLVWTLTFPVDNILSEMCRVTFLLGWWISSRSKKCGKSSRRIPLDILTQDDIYTWFELSYLGGSQVSQNNVSSIDRCFLSDQSVGVAPLLVETLSLGTFR